MTPFLHYTRWKEIAAPNRPQYLKTSLSSWQMAVLDNVPSNIALVPWSILYRVAYIVPCMFVFLIHSIFSIYVSV